MEARGEPWCPWCGTVYLVDEAYYMTVHEVERGKFLCSRCLRKHQDPLYE